MTYTKFFGEKGPTPGKGYVSKKIKKRAVENASQKSYRKTAQDIQNDLCPETIRKEIIKTGEKAKKIEKTKKTKKIINEKATKDPNNQNQTYKKSKGGIIRKILGKICKWERIYILIDGVGVPF